MANLSRNKLRLGHLGLRLGKLKALGKGQLQVKNDILKKEKRLGCDGACGKRAGPTLAVGAEKFDLASQGLRSLTFPVVSFPQVSFP